MLQKTLSGILSLALVAAAQQTNVNVLHEGTPIRMKIDRTISSADATVGENIDFETLDDIKVGEEIVIPKGSTAIGTVTDAKPKGHMGKGGKLNVNIDYVRLPDGGKIPLRGVQDVKGGGHTGAMTGAMVATSIVFFPAAPLFLFMRGKDISIPQGHEITVYTNTEYALSRSKNQRIIQVASKNYTVSGPPLTNADILKLKEAGLSDEIIIQKIKMSSGIYKVNTDDLTALKRAGLSDAVIGSMLSASGAK